MNQTKRMTIKQVAQRAGVSTQTISRVLNDRPDVSPETRQRVQQIIDELGYLPGEVARSLIQQRSWTLGVITAGLKYIGPSMILNGITTEAEAKGYAILLKELPKFDTGDVEPIFVSLLARHVDGILWAVPQVGDNQDWLSQQSPLLPVPLVLLTTPPHPDLPYVDYDNYHGGRIATRHLLDQGYRRIGHLSGPLDWLSARQRKEGWQDALREAGLHPEPHHWVEGNWSAASGGPAVQRLMEQYPEMDAVFVANDQMAMGILQVACKQGLQIPQQLGVVGFDGLAESAFYWPPLTTVAQDLRTQGRTAVSLLVEIIESQRNGAAQPEASPVVLHPQLIVRESSSRP
jgi:DNA-binding LacI/PurR family transcriptional regulator